MLCNKWQNIYHQHLIIPPTLNRSPVVVTFDDASNGLSLFRCDTLHKGVTRENFENNNTNYTRITSSNIYVVYMQIVKG